VVANFLLRCFATEQEIWMDSHTSNVRRHASSTYGSEVFADLFTAWAFKGWNTDIANYIKVQEAMSVMNTNMAAWITAGRR
jgi:hypothetical protein